MDPPPEGEAIEVRAEWIRQWSKTESLETSPLQKLTWIVTSLVGKEPELLLRSNGTAAGLASVHSLGSGTSLLKRGCTLFHSGCW